MTGPKGIWVWDAEGNHLGTIEMPEQPANLTWGDNDYRTLYITATTSVVSPAHPGPRLRALSHSLINFTENHVGAGALTRPGGAQLRYWLNTNRGRTSRASLRRTDEDIRPYIVRKPTL